MRQQRVYENDDTPETSLRLSKCKGTSRRHSLTSSALESSTPTLIKIVCISDTHNSTPQNIPDGDVLLHAGDLTRRGTFDELQAQLDWIATLPHKYKLVIAGNHDLLLDSEFGDVNGQLNSLTVDGEEDAHIGPKRKEDLDWKDIIYLQDSAVTLTFPVSGETEINGKIDEKRKPVADAIDVSAEIDELQVNKNLRTLKIYGTPKVPECGTWAFQYLAVNDVWSGRLPEDVDVVMVHTPPALYCDQFHTNGSSGDDSGDDSDVSRVDSKSGMNSRNCCSENSCSFRVLSSAPNSVSSKGDGYLLQELRRVKPRLVVCGHIHDGYGQTVLMHDEVCRMRELILLERGGLLAIVTMVLWMIYISLIFAVQSLCRYIVLSLSGLVTTPDARAGAAAAVAASRTTSITTRIVNAAVSPGERDDKHKDAITITLLV